MKNFRIQPRYRRPTFIWATGGAAVLHYAR